MNNLISELFKLTANIDNTTLFALSIIPYSIFLYYLYKNKILNWTVKIGFSLTILFVLITIVFSILSLKIYGKSLVEVDMFHGAAESFLTLADLVVLYGFYYILRSKEVKNS